MMSNSIRDGLVRVVESMVGCFCGQTIIDVLTAGAGATNEHSGDEAGSDHADVFMLSVVPPSFRLTPACPRRFARLRQR